MDTTYSSWICRSMPSASNSSPHMWQEPKSNLAIDATAHAPCSTVKDSLPWLAERKCQGLESCQYMLTLQSYCYCKLLQAGRSALLRCGRFTKKSKQVVPSQAAQH